MQNREFGQTISILANVGVIAGIVFLGFELRQNNENLSAQSRYNHAAEIAAFFHSFASDTGMSEILVKARQGEQLNSVEAFQLEQMQLRLFALWQWEYGEFKLGRIPSPTHSWISTLRECSVDGTLDYPGIRQLWEETKDLWEEGFVKFIDDSLSVGGCE